MVKDTSRLVLVNSVGVQVITWRLTLLRVKLSYTSACNAPFELRLEFGKFLHDESPARLRNMSSVSLDFCSEANLGSQPKAGISLVSPAAFKKRLKLGGVEEVQ